MKNLYFITAGVSIGVIASHFAGGIIAGLVAALFAYALWISTIGIIVDEVNNK